MSGRAGIANDGRGSNGSRGRSASGDRETALRQAMHRLLELGGVRAESLSVPVLGRRLHCLRAGRGPRVVVLVQGAGGGAANWYRLMGRLAEHSRVLALDLPGFGLSPSMDLDAPLGEHGATIVRSWLDAMGVDAFDMVGTSLGGLIALRLAGRHPERVRRLVLMDSVGLGSELPLHVRLAGLPVIGPWLTRSSRAGTAWLLRNVLTTKALPPVHESALIEYLWRSADVADHRDFARALRLFSTLRGQREVVADEELAGLTQRTLVLWGARDRFVPTRHGRRAAAHIPDARLELVSGVGHSPNWEAPAAVLDALVPFLAGTDR